jgi:6-pyruvoyl tetrahydropterin synthase/QueD family protein
MSIEITKLFRFEASHSVKGAYTCKCDRERTEGVGGGIHGHSYLVELTLKGQTNKEDGMVIDFSLVKDKFNHIFDAFDHSFIINNEDKVLVQLIPHLSSRYIIFTGNPTAENMAEYFFNYIGTALDYNNVYVQQVTVWETVTGKASKTRESSTYTPPSPLLISTSISSKWTDVEKTTFTENSGLTLPPIPLISSLGIEVLSSEAEIKIWASTQNNKNC